MAKAKPKRELLHAGSSSDDDLLAFTAVFAQCGGGEIDRQTALVRLGASNLEFMRLLASLEERSAGDLDDAQLAQCQTVGDLIDALRRSRRARESFAPKA